MGLEIIQVGLCTGKRGVLEMKKGSTTLDKHPALVKGNIASQAGAM